MPPPVDAPSPAPWHTLPLAPAAGTVLATVSELPANGVVMKQLSHPDATPKDRPFGVLLLCQEGVLRAYVNRCAHFGVPLAAKAEHLIHEPGVSVTCNVHYARFRWRDGLCDRGDCEGESLTSIALDVDADGNVRMLAGPAPLINSTSPDPS